MPKDVSEAAEYTSKMLEKLRRRLWRREKSPGEQAEDEAARRRAQQERFEVERRMAEERQRLESGGAGGGLY
jgi:hypothetical protein